MTVIRTLRLTKTPRQREVSTRLCRPVRGRGKTGPVDRSSGFGEVIEDQFKFSEDRAASYFQDLEIVAIHAGVLVGIGYLFGGF